MTLNDLKTSPMNELLKHCDMTFVYLHSDPVNGNISEIEVRYVPQDAVKEAEQNGKV